MLTGADRIKTNGRCVPDCLEIFRSLHLNRGNRCTSYVQVTATRYGFLRAVGEAEEASGDAGGSENTSAPSSLDLIDPFFCQRGRYASNTHRHVLALLSARRPDKVAAVCVLVVSSKFGMLKDSS